jgi:hypothetical protein
VHTSLRDVNGRLDSINHKLVNVLAAMDHKFDIVLVAMDCKFDIVLAAIGLIAMMATRTDVAMIAWEAISGDMK